MSVDCTRGQKWTYFSVFRTVPRHTHLNKLQLGQGGMVPGTWHRIDMKPQASLCPGEDTSKAKMGSWAGIPGAHGLPPSTSL